MAYIENPFKIGQSVICVNDYFPMVITTAGKERIGTLPQVHPKIDELLEISEILGEYLRFDIYDCKDETHPDYGWRWWKHTHFRPICEGNCTMNYCDENGCVERKRVLTGRSICSLSVWRTGSTT